MYIKSIRAVKNLQGKKVLVRADFNVPVKNGKVADDYKIAKQLDTIRFLLDRKAKIILVSHLGRPEGKIDNNFSLEPVKNRLERYLDHKILLLGDIFSLKTETAIGKMKKKDIIMFENIRFYPEETKGQKSFAKKIAKYADLYVNDSFAVDHRPQATVSVIQQYLPSVAGLLLEQEIVNLNQARQPKKPAVAVFGGIKLKTKMPLLKTYLKKADYILLGGGLANNFLAARGFEVGKSLTEKEGIEFAKKIKSEKIIYPEDVVVSSNKLGGNPHVKKINQINKGDYIFDIGPSTISLYASYIKKASTLIWNGPMGLFELKDFRQGTLSIARLVASRSKGKAFGIVGGGETVEALRLTQMTEYVDWVSTGGGAMLTYLGGEKMPGLDKIIKR